MVDTQTPLAEALQAIADATDEVALDVLRVKYLGKKGSFTLLLKSLGQLPKEDRPAAGDSINRAKRELQEAVESRKASLLQDSLNDQTRTRHNQDTTAVTTQHIRQTPRKHTKHSLAKKHRTQNTIKQV